MAENVSIYETSLGWPSIAGMTLEEKAQNLLERIHDAHGGLGIGPRVRTERKATLANGRSKRYGDMPLLPVNLSRFGG